MSNHYPRFSVNVTTHGDDGHVTAHLHGDDRIALAKRVGPVLTAMDKLVSELTCDECSDETIDPTEDATVENSKPAPATKPKAAKTTRRKAEEEAPGPEDADAPEGEEEDTTIQDGILGEALDEVTQEDLMTVLKAHRTELGANATKAILTKVGKVDTLKALPPSRFRAVRDAALAEM
jgi:hypothetical protein